MSALFDDGPTPAPQPGEDPLAYKRRHARFWARVRVALNVIAAMGLAAGGSLGTAAMQTPWPDKMKLWLTLGAGLCMTLAAGATGLAKDLPRDPWPEQVRVRRKSKAVPITQEPPK